MHFLPEPNRLPVCWPPEITAFEWTRERQQSDVIYRLLGNVCFMVVSKTIIQQDICANSFPLRGKTQDWWEADSFRRNNSAIFAQHSINFSWPNSKKCNQSASEFHYVQELAPLWKTKSGGKKWVKSSHWTGKTTDWLELIKGNYFVQSSQDHGAVLHNCHGVRGFCINQIVHTGRKKDRGYNVMKNDDTTRQRRHYTPGVTTKKVMKEVTAAYYWTEE